MSIKKYTRQEIITRLKEAIQDYDSQVDVDYGPVKDLVVDPISEELRLVNDNIYHVSRIQSLLNYEEMDDEELDNYASNWQVVRKNGTRATGTIWFQSSTPSSSDTEIPLNTFVSAIVEGTLIQFITTEVKTFIVANKESYYNAGEELYEIGVSIEAVDVGLLGNVAAGGITVFTDVSEFTRVVNKEATNGGTDIETNEQLAKRVELVLQGVERMTIQGLEMWMEEQEGVIDAGVIGSQDVLMIRSEAGAVDIAIIGTKYEECQQTTIFNKLEVILDKQPVKSVISIIGPVNEYKEGIEWVFVKDTTSVFSASVRAKSKIEWRSVDTLPVIGESVRITYQYDKKVEELQELVEEDKNRFLSDILIKSAEQIDIEMGLRIQCYSGFNQSSVRQAVKDILYSYINGLKLGQDVEQADLILEIRRISGVDNVIIPFIQLKKEIDPTGTSPADISIGKNEYPRVASGKIEIWSS